MLHLTAQIIAAFRKQIDGIDKAMEKLDKVSAGLHTGKEVDKDARGFH